MRSAAEFPAHRLAHTRLTLWSPPTGSLTLALTLAVARLAKRSRAADGRGQWDAAIVAWLLGLAYHLDQSAAGPSLTMPSSPRLSSQLFRGTHLYLEPHRYYLACNFISGEKAEL